MATGTRRGFTIVELLIVIVVIAILATITVALYDNVATQAYDTSLKSDLKNAQTQLELEQLNGGGYPATAAEVNSGEGFRASGDNSISYARKPYGYCLTASNPEASAAFRLRSMNGSGQIEEGNCEPIVTLLAGSASPGFADGSGTSARFNGGDSGIDVAANGNIYASDFNNDRIRKITPSGDVTTFAGSGASSCSSGTNPATAVSIDRPLGVAYDDRTNTLYFMACSGSRLYKATPDGMVSLLAGGPGGNNCVGSSPAFYWARGITIGRDGFIYVIGTEMAKICKINPESGESTLLAGSGSNGFTEGSGATAQFNWPWSGVYNSSGDLIVKDTRNYRLRKITPSGDVSTFAGAGTSGIADGPASSATFYHYGPHGMAIDQFDTIYLFESNVLRIVSPSGEVSRPRTAAGWYWSYPQSLAGPPLALAFGPDGVLYALSQTGIVKIIL